MTGYPTGVLQNMSAPGGAPDLAPVPETSWRMFSTLEDANKGLDMIRLACPNAQMSEATAGQYSQYVYVDPKSDVRCRIATGQVIESGLPTLAIAEYPSDILDRSTKPTMNDTYTAGQTPVLLCKQISPTEGELYWAAAPEPAKADPAKADAGHHPEHPGQHTGQQHDPPPEQQAEHHRLKDLMHRK